MSTLPGSTTLHDALVGEERALFAYRDILRRLSDPVGGDTASFEAALEAERVQRPALLARRRFNRERLERLFSHDAAALSQVERLDRVYATIGPHLSVLHGTFTAYRDELGKRLGAFKGTGAPRALFSDRRKAQRIRIDA